MTQTKPAGYCRHIEYVEGCEHCEAFERIRSSFSTKLSRIESIGATFSKQEQQRLRNSFPLFAFAFGDGDRTATVQFTPCSSMRFKAGYDTYNSKLTLEHAQLGLAKSLMKLYPCLTINVWLHKDGGYISCQLVASDGRATGFAGQCDITEPNLHSWLSERQDVAGLASPPGFFLCTGHNRAEKIGEYDYFHFAGKYCRGYGEENPEHKRQASNENYD